MPTTLLGELKATSVWHLKNVTEYAVVRVRVTNRRGVVFAAQVNAATRAPNVPKSFRQTTTRATLVRGQVLGVCVCGE